MKTRKSRGEIDVLSSVFRVSFAFDSMAIRSHYPYVRISVGTFVVLPWHGTHLYALRYRSSSQFPSSISSLAYISSPQLLLSLLGYLFSPLIRWIFTHVAYL